MRHYLMKKIHRIQKSREQTQRAEALLAEGNAAEARDLFQAALTKDGAHLPAKLGLAEAYLALDDLGAAFRTFKQAEKLDETASAPLLGLVKVIELELALAGVYTDDDISYWELPDEVLGQLGEMRRLLDDAVARAPQDLEARLRRGLFVSMDFDSSDDAILDLQQVLDAGPQPAARLTRIAVRLLDAGEFDQGLALLRAVEQSMPLDAPALWARIRTCDWPGYHDSKSVRADYEALIALSSKPQRALYGFAMYLEREFNVEDAVPIWAQLTQLTPESFRNHHQHGLALHRAGDYALALDAFDRALACEPDNARAWYHRGNSSRKLKRFQQALHDYTKALEHDPKCAFAYNNRGLVYEKIGQPDLKLQDWHAGVLLSPKNPELNRNLAGHFRAAQDWDSVLSHTEALLHVKPYDRRGLITRGQALRHLGRLDEGLGILQQAVEFYPDDVKALNERGITFGALGHLDLQIEDCRAALMVSPRDKGVKYNLAVRLAQTEMLEEALGLFEELTTLRADRPYDVAWRGECLRRLGRASEGLPYIERALKMGPEDASIMLMLARAQRDLGHVDQATATLERVISFAPDFDDAVLELKTLRGEDA